MRPKPGNSISLFLYSCTGAINAVFGIFVGERTAAGDQRWQVGAFYEELWVRVAAAAVVPSTKSYGPLYGSVERPPYFVGGPEKAECVEVPQRCGASGRVIAIVTCFAFA